MKIKRLIEKYITAKEESEKYFHLDWLTRSIYTKDLEASVKADKEVNRIKKEIRKEVWFWNYILFTISKVKFYNKFYHNNK